MAAPPSEEMMSFVLSLIEYALYGFGVLAVGLTIVFSITFWKSNHTGDSIASIVQKAEIAKLATIVLIIFAVTLLGLLGIIEGQAVVAVLSGIAGYVLGDRGSPTKNSTENAEKDGGDV